MSGTQRVLVFSMFVALLTAAAFTAIFLLTKNLPLAHIGWVAVVLMVLEKRIRRGEPLDERDEEILKRAALIGGSAFWVCFVAICATVSAVASPAGSIPAPFGGFIPVIGYCCFEVLRSSTALVLYARGS